MDLFTATLTVSPLLMAVGAVLFGQKVAEERLKIAAGDYVPNFDGGAQTQESHKLAARLAALVGALPPAGAMVLSVLALTGDEQSTPGWLTYTVVLCLCVQIITAAIAVAIRINEGLKLAGE